MHQFALEELPISPNHPGSISSASYVRPADGHIIVKGLTHGWSSYIEVYRPMFRVHPSFHEPHWTSSYGFDQLSRSPPIEQLDLSTVWRGLTVTEARELYRIEQVFEAHLNTIVVVDKLSKSNSSDCSPQAQQTSERSSHCPIARSTSIGTVIIEIQRLILGIIRSLCHGDRAMSSYRSAEYWRDRVLCYLATCDCLMEMEPLSIQHVIMRTRIRHPMHCENEQYPPTMIEPAWNPDFLTFQDVDVAPREGRELKIVPEYRSFAKSRLDARNISISYTLGRLYSWLEWDEELSGFRGNVPFYSECKASDPVLGEVTKSRFEGTNTVDNLLRIEVVALWRKQVSSSITLEHTVRTRLNLKVVPWFPFDKIRAADDVCLSSVSQKEGAMAPLHDKWKSFPTGLRARPVAALQDINKSRGSCDFETSNLTATPSTSAPAHITRPVNPSPVISESLNPQIQVEQYHLAVPRMLPSFVASTDTESAYELLANLFHLDPLPSPAEPIFLSRPNRQKQCVSKGKGSRKVRVSKDLLADPLVGSEEADKDMMNAIADTVSIYNEKDALDFLIKTEEDEKTLMDAIADAANMYDMMESRNFLIDSQDNERTTMDAIADTFNMYKEMDPGNFLEASHEVYTIAQGVHYNGESLNCGTDPGIWAPLRNPETPPLVMRYYNRFAPLNELRSQSDTLSKTEDGDDDVRLDSGSSTEEENDVLRSTPKSESGYQIDQSLTSSPFSARCDTPTETARPQHGRDVAYGYFLMSMDPGLSYEERENARLVYDTLITDEEEKRAFQNIEEPELTARLNAIIDFDGSDDGFGWTESESFGSVEHEEAASQISSDGTLSLMDEEDEFGGAINFGF